MPAREPLGEGTELPLRGSAVEGTPVEDPSQRLGRKRASLAELSQHLQTHSEPAALTRTAAAVLACYTLARVAANLVAVVWSSFHQMVDAVLRPVITGFGVFLFLRNRNRFSDKRLLHIWCRRAIFALALVVADESFPALVACFVSWQVELTSVLVGTVWEIACNFMQVHMTNLKLIALGRCFTPILCVALWSLGCVFMFPFFYLLFEIADNSFPLFALLAIMFGLLSCCFFLVAVVVQGFSLRVDACAALLAPGGEQATRSAAVMLFVNATLVVLGPALSIWAWSGYFLYIFDDRSPSAPTWLTLDIFLQMCNTLLLSGMIGPKQWDHPMDAFRQLADLSGFGFAAKRIAFEGCINEKAYKCIVSFPGKYSELWDRAVSSVKSQSRTPGKEHWSLACVFLTDTASGLGQHAENPETPGKCWCQSLYGCVPASTYLSVVEVDPDRIDSSGNRDMLAFKRRDAEAMGQLLVVKSEQSDIEWERELEKAVQNAEKLCFEKAGRAPWGCQWFQEWKQNVERANELKQELHVFYFAGRKGQGKMPWEKLSDDTAKEKARQNSGLGASQTAEVAYLEKMGLRYVEHDIKDFKAFIDAAR